VRRRSGATVSVPLAWDEVTATLDPRRFTIYTLEKRVATADPWSDFNRRAQRLPD
jgi:bifunctional non-homologous end joining protein LigD